MLAVSLWTAAVGPIRISAGSATVYQNSTALRPAVVALVLGWLAFQPRTLLELAVSLVLALLLPLQGYLDRINRIGQIEHPARAARDCISRVESDAALGSRGVIDAVGEPHDHRYFYYLRHTGPWVTAPPTIAGIAPHVAGADTLAPILIGRAGYADLLAALATPTAAANAPPDDVRETVASGAVAFDANLGMLLPGAFRACAAPILAAGGQAIWTHGPAGGGR
jgi:hypothetical protein